MWQEIFVSLVLIILLALLFNPFGFMPNFMVMMLLLAAVLVFAIFASFIWREKSKDEREDLHRMVAGRIAYLVGAGILMLAIVIQSLKHDLDDWLLVALGAMILAKVGGLIYSRIKY